MVAESPSHVGDLVVPAPLGAVLGLAFGGALCWWTGMMSPWSMVGFVLLGLLYSLCQHRASWLGYLLVGLSYGILIYLVTHLLCKLQLVTQCPLALEGRGNFRHCLAFSESLALSGLLVSLLQGQKNAVLPKD